MGFGSKWLRIHAVFISEKITILRSLLVYIAIFNELKVKVIGQEEDSITLTFYPQDRGFQKC